MAQAQRSFDQNAQPGDEEARMNGPERTPLTGVPWHTDPPAPNRLVEVWYFVGAQLATWDGAHWHNVDGQPLPGVTHWRERTPGAVKG